VELLAYIKELLLLNDCVIIPGFGGFVTNYKQAGLNASNFTAPSKSVSFNKKLNFNDGLFINHVASELGINYIAARKKIDLMVQELNYRLTDGEEIAVSGLGILKYDEQQHLVFTPKIETNLNIDAFGLGSFSYESLFARQVARQAISQQDRQAVEVIFQKRSLKKVLLAVPLLFALAVIPLKNNTILTQKSNIASIQAMMTPVQTVVEPTTEEITETVSIVEEQTAEIIEEQTPAVAEINYFLIVGSFKSAENADKFIQQLDKKGFQGTNIGVINGMHYISLGGYTEMEEALVSQKNYRAQSSGSGAWIYKKPQ